MNICLKSLLFVFNFIWTLSCNRYFAQFDVYFKMSYMSFSTFYIYTESRGVKVDRVYCGPFTTSLEMAGVSITLLHLDDTLTTCLGKVILYTKNILLMIRFILFNSKIHTNTVGRCTFSQLNGCRFHPKYLCFCHY